MSRTSTCTITGRTCGHCVAAVTEQVSKLPGVEQVEVGLETGALAVTSSQSIDPVAIRASVEDAGCQRA